MAVKAFTRTAMPIGEQVPTGVLVGFWDDLDAGDSGTPVPVCNMTDKAVTIELGTAGDSTITIQGSLEPTNPTVWHTLNDPQGNALTGIATSRIEQILENVYFIRPLLGGTTGANWVVRLIASTTARR